MSDNVENMIIEHLKRFQAGQDRIDRKLEEITRRLSNLEAGQASIIGYPISMIEMGSKFPRLD